MVSYQGSCFGISSMYSFKIVCHEFLNTVFNLLIKTNRTSVLYSHSAIRLLKKKRNLLNMRFNKKIKNTKVELVRLWLLYHNNYWHEHIARAQRVDHKLWVFRSCCRLLKHSSQCRFWNYFEVLRQLSQWEFPTAFRFFWSLTSIWGKSLYKRVLYHMAVRICVIGYMISNSVQKLRGIETSVNSE